MSELPTSDAHNNAVSPSLLACCTSARFCDGKWGSGVELEMAPRPPCVLGSCGRRYLSGSRQPRPVFLEFWEPTLLKRCGSNRWEEKPDWCDSELRWSALDIPALFTSPRSQ